MSGKYRSIADGIAKEIMIGVRPVGSKLLPQREFAYSQKIAPSTASRVYEELRKRGLIEGRVGQGTVVSCRFGRSKKWLQDPAEMGVDLEFVAPFATESQLSELASITANATKLAGWAQARSVGDAALVESVLAYMPWIPTTSSLQFTGRARQAIAAILMATVPPGGRLAVEQLTYPYLKAYAELRCVRLVPIEMDSEGILPDALHEAHRSEPLNALFLQPRLHNPTTRSMTPGRRKDLLNFIDGNALIAIEDGVYGFLGDDEPLASEAPENVIYVESLSKKVSPSLGFGLTVAPKRLIPDIEAAIAAGAWTPTCLSLLVGAELFEGPLLNQLLATKRELAQERMQIAKQALAGQNISAPDASFHLWWNLPPKISENEIIEKSMQLGLAIAPGSRFAVGPTSDSAAVRLSLTHLNDFEFCAGLDALASRVSELCNG